MGSIFGFFMIGGDDVVFLKDSFICRLVCLYIGFSIRNEGI